VTISQASDATLDTVTVGTVQAETTSTYAAPTIKQASDATLDTVEAVPMGSTATDDVSAAIVALQEQVAALQSTIATALGPYDLKITYPGIPPAGETILADVLARTVQFPANLTGSKFLCSTAPTNDYTIDVTKNGTTVATIVFAAGQTTAAMSTPGAAAFSGAAGDVIRLVTPVSLDVIKGICGTLTGTRGAS